MITCLVLLVSNPELPEELHLHRVDLDDGLVDAMNRAEASKDPITTETCATWGVSMEMSKELNGFLKDRCTGTAEAIVRSNKTGIGLESWRMLSNQFNPRTLAGALSAQDKETRPKGATKLSQMPNALLEWEKDLRRCIADGAYSARR